MMLFPDGILSISGVDKASAATTVPDPNFSIQLSMGETLNTEEELESGVVGYISNNFTVSTTSTASYSIYLSPDTTNGYSNKLIGEKHKQEILGIGSNVSVSNFTNNTWGYGLTNPNETNTANNTLTYSTIPDGSTPIKTVNNPDDGNDTYKLVFAAKINNEKPVDHYQSQAMLSVLASPKSLITYTITYNGNGSDSGSVEPQTFSTSAESYTFTLKGQGNLVKDGYNFLGWADSPSATAAGPSQVTLTKDAPNKTVYAVWKQVFGGITTMQQMTSTICNNASENDSKQLKDARDNKLYTITKLKGSAGCWMTENMDYATGRMYHHDTYGGYYNWDNAKKVCNFIGWQLPTQAQYQALLDAYDIKDNSAGSTTLRSAPLNFLYGGLSDGGSPISTGSRGSYWSSTPNDNYAYRLGFLSNSVGLFDLITSDGYSVRCVAK